MIVVLSILAAVGVAGIVDVLVFRGVIGTTLSGFLHGGKE